MLSVQHVLAIDTHYVSQVLSSYERQQVFLSTHMYMYMHMHMYMYMYV